MQTVAVVGLGYVGLPLAVAFGRVRRTIGFDLNRYKISAYREHVDPTGEVSTEDLRAASELTFSSEPEVLAAADLVIVAVPTPVDRSQLPDFEPLISASTTVGKHLKPGAIVIYESTVYPGATEEICVPVLEKASGLKWRTGFHVGYSPERINPGDKQHRLETIVKVVSGDDPATLEAVAELYGSIVTAGVHRASSIAVAEAAKVIENTQRDINIALMNELALIFGKLGLDTQEVLEAAGTKWNFLPFRPGLVGGHCIGVDPYYLTYKAQMVGHHPEVILAGRRINNHMSTYVAEQTVKQLVKAGRPLSGARVTVLGLSFKENVPDLRNSKVVDIIHELQAYGLQVSVHDPVVAQEDAKHEYCISLMPWDALPVADAMVLAVPHREFLVGGARRLAEKIAPGGCFIDVKSAFPVPELAAERLRVWRL
jgi:UDP-N-acetyl-D-galactosamine dehydrogenase